jgi:hypothetical protein
MMQDKLKKLEIQRIIQRNSAWGRLADSRIEMRLTERHLFYENETPRANNHGFIPCSDTIPGIGKNCNSTDDYCISL